MVKVTIIVPVYNASLYLEECIQSVLDQTCRSWELLLVDDGSKDDSGEICEWFAQQDARIKVVHQENSGVSAARNKAMDIAQGKYLIFLDSDDYWYDCTALERLLTVAEEHDLDLVRGEYKAVDEVGNDLFIKSLTDARKQYSYKVLNSSQFLRYAVNGEFFLVLTLFKVSAVKNYRFPLGKIFLEDMLFYSTLCLQSLRCWYVPDVRFYAYRKNSSSVSAKVNVKKLQDSFAMCESFHDLSTKTDDSELKQYYQKYSIMMYFYTLETLATDEYYKNYRQHIVQCDLVNLQEKVSRWRKLEKIDTIPLIFDLSPKSSIRLLRVKFKLALIKRRIKELFAVK